MLWPALAASRCWYLSFIASMPGTPANSSPRSILSQMSGWIWMSSKSKAMFSTFMFIVIWALLAGLLKTPLPVIPSAAMAKV
ncbi:hypothetical protein C1I93_21690 [Micromonospora endophytica]|uniref:Uncharacterized protein n=1 Tax=Micromonospora endophytica TaxID=515350 RepID=A0A2W2BVE7_9ACTN|nr:hypothetical protein C1I93_21690 [Micromonospora endophytica]RIW45428.1 hypothetical protein D3H59_15200 [Micromonospora endophytica]